jgi:hypothetical protein
MQVIIPANFRTVPVLLSAFKGRISQANKEAILAAFEASADEVLAEAAVQQDRGDIFATARIGNAIVSTENSRTMVSRIVDEKATATHDVATVKEAAALVKTVYGCDIATNVAGPRTRLHADGRIISCGKVNTFTAEQMAASQPIVATLVSNRGAILAYVL